MQAIFWKRVVGCFSKINAMEEYKDVMLSEPPARYANNASAAQLQSLSLENYKGILLCDRPADARNPGGAAKAPHGGGPAPFLPAGKGDERNGLGLQPSIEQRSGQELSLSVRQRHSTHRATALTRHRKWLNSFASAVKQMQLEKAEHQITKTLKEGDLREKQASLRNQTRPEETAVAEVQPVETAPAEVKAVKKKSKKKPVWAQTEDEAADAEFSEARNLVDFAAGLDFDQFMNDFEVREALAVMRDRVQEIAADKGIDLQEAMTQQQVDDNDDTVSVAASDASTVTREIVAARRAEKRKQKAAAPTGSTAGWDKSTNLAEKLKSAVGGDALALAEKILATSESMRHIHSKQSLARVLQDVTFGAAAKNNMEEQVALQRGQALAPPVVSFVSPDAASGSAAVATDKPPQRVLTELRKSKSQVQNLPYLYRCPSI
jgi:hypothetical protein